MTVDVTAFDPSVSANERTLDAMTPTNGPVGCLQQGAPPGHYALTGSLSLARSSKGSDPATVERVVTIADGALRDVANVTLDPGEHDDRQLLATTEADGSLSPGNQVRVRATIRSDGQPIETVTETVEVRGASTTDCEPVDTASP